LLEDTRLEMFQDQVFCFTPKGDLIALPQGATLIDFAYAVHSEVGDKCVGARVNGRMVPLATVLNNGDQVEIVTSKAQTPSPDWARFVVTGKARARIRRFIRSQERDQYCNLGRAILDKTFRQSRRRVTQKALAKAAEQLQMGTEEELLVSVGDGRLSGKDVLEAIHPTKTDPTDKKPRRRKASKQRAKGAASDGAISLKGLIPGMAVHYAGCCHPLPGERIVGIVTTGKGVTVHTLDCETLESFAETPERWLEVNWNVDTAATEIHIGRLKVTISNEPGSLGDLSTVIGKGGGNITNLKITNRSTDFFEMLVDIRVEDIQHLTEIVAALRASPVISFVERARD
jgi:guanosine-3',5'-bis(diphosphate) 3'-pyrophosphohydrolase